MDGTLFVFSAPSGAGKTTVINAVLEQLKSTYALGKVITYTSRPMRIGEIDGQDYFFVTPEEFEQKRTKGEFLEWSTWYDNYYGSPACVLEELKKGKSFLVILDRFGAQAVKQRCPEAVLVWLIPPSLEVLEERLKKRGTDSQEEIRKRLAKAAIEMSKEKEEKMYAHHIINDDFNETTQKVINCVIAEITKK